MKVKKIFFLPLVFILLSGCFGLNQQKNIEKQMEEQKKQAEKKAEEIQKNIEKQIQENLKKSSVPAVSEDEEVKGKELGASEKLNVFVACNNDIGSRAQDSYHRYLSWVDKDKGPTCKESKIYWGVFAMFDHSLKSCKKAVAYTEALPVTPELDVVVKRLAELNEKLVKLTKEASDYYEQEDYKDDQCAKAKEFHPQLVTGLEEFFKVQEQFRTEFDKLKIIEDQKALSKIESESGKNFQWYTIKLLIDSKTLLDQIPNSGSVKKEEYLAKFTVLDTTYEGMQSYIENHKEEVDKVFWNSAYLNSSKDFFTAAKKLKREVAEGKTPDVMANKVIETFNRFVSDNNNLRF